MPDKKYGWQKAGLRLWLLVLTALLLTITAGAGPGPGRDLPVKVLHPPAGPYEIAILGLDPLESYLDQFERSYNVYLPQERPALRQALDEHMPDGWVYMESETGGPSSGERRDSFELPTTDSRYYCLFIRTEAGEVWLSEPLRKLMYQSYVIVDWGAKTAWTPPAWLGILLQTVLPLFFALCAGWLNFWFERIWLLRYWKSFLWVSFCTQGLLYLGLGVLTARWVGPFIPLIMILLLPVEWLLLALGGVLARCFLHVPPDDSLKGSITRANVFSLATGFVAAPLVWDRLAALLYTLPQ